MDLKRKRSFEVITPGSPPHRPPPSLRNSTRLQQLEQYNIRLGAIDLGELAVITLDTIECLGFVIVGLNDLPREPRSAGATLLDAATTGLKAIDTLLHGLRFARKFHGKLDHLSQQGQLSTILRDLTEGKWEKLGLLACKAHSCILDCLSVMRESQNKFLSVSDVPIWDDFVLIMEISESQKCTGSLSNIVTTFKLAELENPLFRLRRFLEVEISMMIWPPSESDISPRRDLDVHNHNESLNLEHLRLFFKDMALVPIRYRAYLPSLPTYELDRPVIRSPACLPFIVGGIDDHDCLSKEASGGKGFERVITPLLEFDWNEPWNTIPDILRWIVPFLKSTQQEHPPDISEIGLLADIYLKGIILLVESLRMGRLFLENYATNAAWYFERREIREKYSLVLGENEGYPWKIAAALSKYSLDSFALAKAHANALRAQFERNNNWTQIPTLTSEEYPCYLAIRRILETFCGPLFEKLRSLSYTWNRLWNVLKFPGSFSQNIHLEDIGEETLKLWYDEGSYVACELLYHQMSSDAKTGKNINLELWTKAANWIYKTIAYNNIQSNPPFTYPIWSEVFFGDLHLIPERFRTQIAYTIPPIAVVRPHAEQFLTDAELDRLQVFHQYICRKDEVPIKDLCNSVIAISNYYFFHNRGTHSYLVPGDYETAIGFVAPWSTLGPSLHELSVHINGVFFDLLQSVLKAFQFVTQFYTLFGTPSPSGPRVVAEPKLQLFNTLDIATGILYPLVEYEDKFKNIYVILDHLAHIYVGSGSSGEPKDNEIPILDPQQLIKLVGDLERGIQEWYRWWTWTRATEHSPENFAECISINAILWSGSLQTNWDSLQSLDTGFKSVSESATLRMGKKVYTQVIAVHKPQQLYADIQTERSAVQIFYLTGKPSPRHQISRTEVQQGV
ncbi:hypothetical protein M422DRAFT_250503 [Sphaerobolus stellatus SS14]|uniref:Uncharacterized protein n=1 Tax=Sphaerobolus stellatus (strain SS14) TaxID=990650 RepID=A0A0C9UTA2_SPHS4|nr:hypothetical protein M422DRAFT_250503 [Sphaerobolus stellatus SS14]